MAGEQGEGDQWGKEGHLVKLSKININLKKHIVYMCQGKEEFIFLP